MDKFSAMRTFVRVVEAGNFTKAADSLGVPKGQMSRLVLVLEKELKTQLLNRTTRRVTVTADGAAYYDRAVRLLDELEELESSMSRAKAAPRGVLRVDAPSAIASLVLIPALSDFRARYPDIHVDIGVSDKPVDLVGENVDCVLRAGEVSDPSLVARRIGEIDRFVCASPAYLKRHGVPRHPSDLESDRHHVISYFSHGAERLTYVLQRGVEQYEVHALSAVAVNDSGAMLAAGLAGLGIARTAPFMAAPHLAAGTLIAVLPEWSAGTWGWRTVFLAAALVDVALLAIVSRSLPAVRALTTISYGRLLRSLGNLVREERVLRISAATAFMMFAAFSALWATLAALLAQPPYAFGPAAVGAFGLVALLGIAASPRIGALADRLDARTMLLAGALALAIGFAFIAAGGRGLGWMIVGMVLLDFGNRAGLVANQTRVYALRPEARSRLNTVFMGAYFLGGAAGAALGSYGAHRGAWTGLAAVGASLALAAAAINTLSSRSARTAIASRGT